MQRILQWLLTIPLRWIRQPYSPRFYDAIARLITTVPVEAVILRQTTGGIEIFLQQRKSHESYPGMWCCPGSVIRPGEEPFDVLHRVMKKELNTDMVEADLVGVECCQETRGWFCEIVYLVTLDREPANGSWAPVDHLPPMASNHAAIIPMAVHQLNREGLV